MIEREYKLVNYNQRQSPAGLVYWKQDPNLSGSTGASVSLHPASLSYIQFISRFIFVLFRYLVATERNKKSAHKGLPSYIWSHSPPTCHFFMNFYTRPLERSGSTAATHWTVRSPYRTVRDDNGQHQFLHLSHLYSFLIIDDVVSDQPSDEPGPSNNDPKPPVSKSIRSTRPTPAFLPNFVRTEPENPTHGEPTRLYNNRNPMYSFPCGMYSFCLSPCPS